MFSFRTIVVVYVSVVCAVQVLFLFLMRGKTGYVHAFLYRLNHVINIEFIFCLASWFLCQRIWAFFETTIHTKEDELVHEKTNGNGKSQNRRLIALFCVIFVVVGSHLSYPAYYFQRTVPPWISFICLIAHGVWVHLVALLLGFSLVNFLTRTTQCCGLGRRVFGPFLDVRIIEKVLLDSRFQTSVAIFLTVVLSVFGLICAQILSVTRVDITLRKLPPHVKGLRMAMLSDMHIGPSVWLSQVQRVVDKTNAEHPDIVVIVGDLTDASVEDIRRKVQPLQQLNAKHGVYFVTGNHDYYYGNVDEWLAALRSLGVRPLHNAHALIPPTNPGLCLVGVDDVFAEKIKIKGHRMNLTKALEGCGENLPRVVLAHNPKAVKKMKLTHNLSSIDLILSGHIHAGQLYVMAPVLRLFVKYFYGLYRLPEGGQIFVSSGVHYWAAPMKMAGFAEIVMITLN